MTSAKPTDREAASPREKLLLSMVEAIQDLVLVLDRDYKVVLSNWRGFGHPSPIGPAGEIYCFQALKQRAAPCENCHVREVFATGQVKEVELTSPIDGRILEIRAFPFIEEGRVTLVVVHARDVTSRKLTEAELRESEARFRQLFDHAADAIFLHDKGKFVEVNRQACASLGYTREELFNMSILDIEMEHHGELPKMWEEKLPEPKTIVGTHRRRDGSTFPVEVRTADFIWQGRRLRLSLVRDISERRRAEAEIRAHQEQLRSLATELSLTEERERRRLAGDLHDHIGQLLALAKMKLGAVRQEVEPLAWRGGVEEVRDLVEQAIAATRSLTFELSMPILYEVGLEEAVEWLAEQFHQQQGLDIEVRRPPDALPLSEAARGLLFRIVRELLTNVVKHSRARKVSLSLEKKQEKLSIQVKDDGVGFDMAEISSKMREGKVFGLFSIRERLSSIGGQVNVHSAPHQGTRVNLAVPLAAVLDFQGGKS